MFDEEDEKNPDNHNNCNLAYIWQIISVSMDSWVTCFCIDVNENNRNYR